MTIVVSLPVGGLVWRKWKYEVINSCEKLYGYAF
jgi:hypothetical protein